MTVSRPTWVGLAPVGVVLLRGADRLDLLHRLSTNDVARLARPGATFGTVFTNEKGRVIDWVLATVGEGDVLLRTSAGRAEGVRAWIERYTVIEDVVAEDATARWAMVVVDGPAAASLVADPGDGRAAPVDGGLVTRGLAALGPRLELLVAPARAESLVSELEAKGARRADDSVLERLRLEAGVPSPEHEFREEVSPLELRLGSVAVSFSKGCYIGQEVIARLDSYDKLARVLMGFETDAAVAGELKLQRDGRPLGRVTSSLGRPEGGTLGLAVVRRDGATPGPVVVVGEAGSVEGRLVDRPFWKAT